MNYTQQTIRILVAAYNGSRYLGPLLDSLLAQDDPDYDIIVSDDGSSDDTPQILADYAGRYPDKIRLYRSGRRFGCSQLHFYHLMTVFQDAPYLMFCDQDDVWHPDKVRLTRTAMERLGAKEIPALVHTDLRVVDRELRELAPSFLRFSGLDGRKTALSDLLVQNVVTGCTMMVNRPLSRLCCSVPPREEMRMHDWWLALLAAACGKIGFLDQPTIDYRQHGGNVVGAKNSKSPAYLLGRLRNPDVRESFLATAAQAAALLESYGGRFPQEQRRLCEIFASLPQQSKRQRLRLCRQYHFYKQGLPRKIGQLLWW